MHLSAQKLAVWRRFCSSARRQSALFLPLVLTAVFVVQNYTFNVWLNITPTPYYRLCAASFALGLLLFGPAALLRLRWRAGYLAVVSVLISVIFIAEYLYYSYSADFLQISALRLLRESSAIGGTVMRLLTPRLIVFGAGPAVVLAAAWLARRLRIVHVRLMVREALLTAFVVVAWVLSGYGLLYAAERADWGDASRLYSRICNLNDLVGKMGVVNYFLEDAARRALQAGRVTAADSEFVRRWNADRPAPATGGAAFGLARGRNLIFIMIESLQGVVIGARMGGNEIVPSLDALARQGLYFSNYYAPIDLGKTADAEFATLNSLYPLPDSVAFIEHAQNRYAALPSLLAEHGYRTCALHGDDPAFWNRAAIYPGLGYRSWFSKRDYVSTRPIGITGLGDEDFFKQSLPKLEGLPRPFMATLITLSSHTPFVLPDDVNTLDIPADSKLSHEHRIYLQSLHYVDRALGDFIERLKKTDIYENSLIVIAGDHGGFIDISAALDPGSDDLAGVKDDRVPLIFLAPGTMLKGERQIPASHIDLYPTVAHLLGFNAPRSVLGQDLLNTETPVAIFRKNGTDGITTIIGGNFIYMASADGIFKRGTCLATETRLAVPIEECRVSYERQSAVLRVSDTIVRGDMLGALLEPTGTDGVAAAP
jgi:lipoteichoic acid synthase